MDIWPAFVSHVPCSYLIAPLSSFNQTIGKSCVTGQQSLDPTKLSNLQHSEKSQTLTSPPFAKSTFLIHNVYRRLQT